MPIRSAGAKTRFAKEVKTRTYAKIAIARQHRKRHLKQHASSTSSDIMAALSFPRRLEGKRVALFIDYQFEDLEVTYPMLRLQEEGCEVVVVGAHPAGQKYTGKFGYPVKSHVCIEDFSSMDVDGLVLPGGFAPDYMRRNKPMLEAITTSIELGKPCAAICHGPWMFCSARFPNGAPVCTERSCTSFVAIKDDLINAGATWVDAPVVVDGPLITARTPADLIPFMHALIEALIQSPARAQ